MGMYGELCKHFIKKNILFITIPVIIIIVVSAYFLQSFSITQNKQMHEAHINEIASENLNVFDTLTESMNSVAAMLAEGSETRQFFLGFDVPDYHKTERELKQYVDMLRSSFDNIPIRFLSMYSSSQDKMFSTSAINQPVNDALRHFETNKTHSYQYSHIDDGDTRHLIYTIAVRLYGIHRGGVLFEVDDEALIKRFNLNSIRHFALYDRVNEIIVFSDETEFMGKTVEDYYNEYSAKKCVEKRSNRSAYALIYMPQAAPYQFTVQSALPMTLFLVVSLLCLVIFIWLLARIFLIPANKMADVIFENDNKYIADGKKGVTFEYISEKVNETYRQNKELKGETLKNMQLLNQMHTSALQSQINPHFLFNTLQMINISIEDICDAEENNASQMIKMLSQLIRANFSTRSHLTTLADELQHVTTYHKLQNIVYNNRIKLDISIPEKYHMISIPKVTLQPIVENCIVHGLMSETKEININVECNVDKDTIEIYVKDNGEGMDEEQVLLLNRNINIVSELQESHIGLSNTNQRIKLIFGTEYGINVSSKKGSGTTVKIRLPIVAGDKNK